MSNSRKSKKVAVVIPDNKGLTEFDRKFLNDLIADGADQEGIDKAAASLLAPVTQATKPNTSIDYWVDKSLYGNGIYGATTPLFTGEEFSKLHFVVMLNTLPQHEAMIYIRRMATCVRSWTIANIEYETTDSEPCYWDERLYEVRELEDFIDMVSVAVAKKDMANLYRLVHGKLMNITSDDMMFKRDFVRDGFLKMMGSLPKMNIEATIAELRGQTVAPRRTDSLPVAIHLAAYRALHELLSAAYYKIQDSEIEVLNRES